MIRDVKPEDVIWEGDDPLGRHILDLQSIHDARRDKHPDASHLSDEEVRSCITTPSQIDISAQVETRCNYYRYAREYGKPPYQRVTVAFEDSEFTSDGIIISYSRARKSAPGTLIYLNLRNNP